MATEVLKIWKYGEPTLSSGHNGSASWVRAIPPRDAKGSTGWHAKLNGGAQTGDDWARINIPVNELHLTEFALAKWSYYMTAAQSMGVGIVIWVHDPDDFDNRAEITQLGGHADLGKAAGWNAFEFTQDTAGMFFYGEGTTGTALTAGTQYTWQQVRDDALFKTWDIYRVSLEYGWEASGSFGDVYVADIQLNKKMIPLKPTTEELLARDSQSNALPTISTWSFGKPTLRSYNNASAEWANYADTGGENSVRYGSYVAKLTGGTQAGYASKAGVYFPVNKMKLTDITSLLYAWYADATEAINPFLAMHVYDPNDPEIRADINYSNGAGGGTGVPAITSGWHDYEMVPGSSSDTTYPQWFWYGNGVSGSGIGEGAVASFQDFIDDPVFSTFVIGQIEVMSGSYTTSYINPIYVAKIEVNGTDIVLEPSITEQLNMVRDDMANALTTIPTWTFGRPSLAYAKNSIAYWDRDMEDPRYHPSSTNWKACLHGRVQTNDDYAALVIPVNEIPIPEFKTALWTYIMTTTQTMGANIVLWCHDPDNFIYRAEITQDATVAGLTKTSGRNAHVFNTATTQMFWGGEITGSPDNCPTHFNNYTWANFQTDSVFSKYTIYKITIEMGWEASGTFDPVWIGDVVLNGELIPLLGPVGGGHRKTVVATKLMTTATHAADEVIAQSVGTDWDFVFGGSGYITKALITHNASLSSRVSLFLYSNPPNCDVDDEDPNTGPVAADAAFYLGRIDFPAFSYQGSGDASALCTPSTVGNLPIAFDSTTVYGVLVALDETITVAENLTIALTADMEDN